MTKNRLLMGSVGAPLVAFWLIPSAVLAHETPRSVSLEKSAWVAKLSPAEVASRVAAPFLRRENFPVGYTSDIQLEALMALGDATGEQTYLEFVQQVMLDRKMPPGYVHPYESEEFCSLSVGLFERTRNQAYIEPFLAETRKYRAQVLCAFDGAISIYRDDYCDWYAKLKPEMGGPIFLERKLAPILIDQLQEYASRMAKAGWLSDEPDFYTEAAEQIQVFRAALRDPTTGLWGHGRGWFKSAQTMAETHWGRGHGWLMRGLVETLTYLPPDSLQARQVSAILHELAETLMKYQDTEGFWHQVIDRPDSYQETSATGFISYYLARAVRQGLLPEKPYRNASVKAFEALARRKISAEGVVYGASQATPPMASTDDYMRWETPINDHHGVAGVIFSAAGQLLLEGKGAIPRGQHVTAAILSARLSARPNDELVTPALNQEVIELFQE